MKITKLSTARIIRTLQQNKKFHDVLLFVILPIVVALAITIMLMLIDIRLVRQKQVEIQKEILKKDDLIQIKHLLEHQNAEIVLVDNSHNSWNATASPDLTIKGYTVTNTNENHKWYSIRTSQGISTNTSGDGQLRFKVNYAEFTIGSFEGTIYLYLASMDFAHQDGTNIVSGTYYLGIDDLGYVCESTTNCAVRKVTDGFKSGDTIGIGLLVVQKSATAEAANCARCRQPKLWLFYTKNGEIWGDPKPLPANVPSHLYPTIVFEQPGAVTANFVQKQFVYEIPPAKGLCVGHQCQKPIF